MAETRDRIVDAVIALVTEEHPAAISVPAVARRAGVSVATVYRYYPTKEQLLDAATEVGHRRTSAVLADSRHRIESGPRIGTAERDALVEVVVGQLFAEFGEHLDYVRQAGSSPVGRDLRRRRRPDKQRELRAVLTALDVDPDGVDGRRLATAIELLASSTVFVELHDHLGLSTAEATAHVVWALTTLVEASR